MSPTQQEALFEKYDFDTQYQTYIYGNQQIEPPTFYLAKVFAREGSRIVQPLKAKLDRAENEATIRDIVFVFRDMNELGTYDVAADKPLLDELRVKVLSMKNSAWRKVCEGELDEIVPQGPK